uniref:tRNA pseudouridine synthase 1 n=1 Tax=Cajanus cajan TaxID=3821 RepID=A0A151TZY3_CAJCA|nr:tRNA pseudouridine synthase 1 [Cajanus cajan]
MENSDTMLTTSSLPPPPPVAVEEPEPKKLKMSTTTSDDEECATTTGSKIRYKRHKVAIFFAYCGVGYQGMQKNPGAKTIEGDLEEALYVSGAVPEQDRGIPKRYDWARSARTDKGVSAVGQVVSGRFYIDPPGLVDRLNSNLTSQIRIFGYKRVTGSFNAKKFCDRRRETVMASLGSGNELVKCFECSERGRKVVGLVGNRKHNLELEAMDVDAGISSNKNVVVDSSVTDDVGVSLSKVDDNHLNEASVNDNTGDVNSKTDIETVIPVREEGTPLNDESVKNSDILEEEKVNGEDESTNGSGFCYGEKERERFNKILKYFVGTHNFHNFTTRTKAEDPAARRYIISFNANITLVVEGMEFVKCEVVGQSFMLHQIRKMIGLAVAIMRNCAPESLIDKAFQQDVNINVPTAPEVGLYLDECFFSSYNQKWKDSHEELSMKDYEKEAEEFKMKYIYSHISSTEQKEGTVALWLHSLNHRNYPDLRIVNEEAIPDNNRADIEEAIPDNKRADIVNDNKRAAIEEPINDNKRAAIEEAINDNKRADIEETITDNKRVDIEEAVDDNKRADIEDAITDNKSADPEVMTE